MPEIHIQNWPDPVPFTKETILDAGLTAGVPIPNQCRSGECGSCKCQLVRGEVQRLPHVAGTLSQDELAEGWILACRSKAKGTVEVRFPAPLGAPVIAPGQHGAEVVAITRETADVVALRLRPLAPVRFHAGQYFDLTLPGKPARSYSPANTPDDREMVFYVKVLPDGCVSPSIAAGLEMGTHVLLNGPFGSSCLSQPPDGPVLLLGGGTGIAPLISIAKSLAKIAPDTPCQMYFGVRTEEDVFAQDALASISSGHPNFKLAIILSDRQESASYRTGFIGPALREDNIKLGQHRIFVAGPPVMVERCQTDLMTLGADPSRISIDSFLPSEPERAPAPMSGLMRMARRLLGSAAP
jgi:NAD(P)H-flavin reductase